MTSKAPGPRERLIATGIAMVRERGIHATGLSDLLKRSSAARNSIYQHFPGGKTELMVAVTETAAGVIGARIDRLAADGDPLAVIHGLIDRWVADMQEADFATGCPIAAASLAGPDEPPITEAAARAFTLISDRVAAALAASGMDDETARSRASFAVSAIEGALLQARAQRSIQPLRDVESELVRYFR
jgi:TetR/AcrR family transcriptional repressor of lmrAB and yxaGH operons